MTDERARIREGVAAVLAWYPGVRRALPWREAPDAYRVWISEIMLQQTRIEAVIPYYRRFLAELPDVQSLAAVEEERLLKLWEGLGYYSRARNLRKAAVQVCADYGGTLPKTAAELRKLPGIGDYTAGAIASIAWGEPEPAVDGNVLRVLLRLLARRDDAAQPRTRAALAALLKECYPSGRDAGLVTEGLMELGETLCVPNAKPRCALCPWEKLCLARQNGSTDSIPLKSPPRPRRVEARTVLLLRWANRWALRRRTEGPLRGMWEFPSLPGALTPEEAEEAILALGAKPLGLTPCGEARHVFTHVEWHMRGYLAELEAPAPALTWAGAEDIRARFSLPTAFRFYWTNVVSR